MTSTSSRPSETMSPPPVFSYAQAAKGRTNPSASSTLQTNHTSSGVSTPPKDVASTLETPSVGSERGSGSVNGSHDTTTRSDTHGEASSTEQKGELSSKAVSIPTSPSFGTASTATLPKEDKDDDFVLVGHSSESTRERHTEGGRRPERSGEEKEGRRGKKGKKQKNAEKEAEKEKEEVKQEVLVPAPIPTVNFWQQRREEAAKAKTTQVGAIQGISETSTSNAVKPNDIKPREKSSTTEDGDKAALPNGISKEPGKGQKKGNDAAAKTKEEQSAKRAGSRGNRVGDKEEKVVIAQAPPPVEDAMSWPTPETAVEEEKRKAQEKPEREDKDESNSNKPRQKEKWVTVPYTPSVTFNTPMPTRGARGRGGARGGRTEAGSRSGNPGAEKSSSTTSPAAEGRSAKETGARAASLPPVANRQPNEQSGSRNQRKPTLPSTEKAKNEVVKSELTSSAESRIQNPNGSTEAFSNQLQDHHARESSKGVKQDSQQGSPSEAGQQSRSGRQSESGLRGTEGGYGKDNQTGRERTDGRPDRGRGGFRGRGGHNGFPNGQHPQHNYVNGHASQVPNAYPVRSNSGLYSPPIQTSPFGNQYSTSNRNGRNNNVSRSQSIPNNAMYRHPYGPGATQHITPLQTSNSGYDYPMQPISAGPFNPYIDGASIAAMVTMQLDYYFSIDNLCKDVYLRKHMDGKGFVFLSFIAGFKRIQSLTQDFELLKFACIESEIIESVKGDDGLERLRRRDGWEKWVLAPEERDEAARHAGPAQTMPLHLAQRMQPIQHMMTQNHHAINTSGFTPNGTEQMYRPYSNGFPAAPVVNGNGTTFHAETPLSAAVPDFAPGLPPVNGNYDLLESEVTFSDEEVAKLIVVFATAKSSDDSKPKLPFHGFSSRTFSNGSIDSRSIAEEIHDDSRLGRTLSNGTRATDSSPEDFRRSRDPFESLSPTTKSPVRNNSPPVMWVKGQPGERQQPVTDDNTQSLYTSFRSRALMYRETSAPGETHPDMKHLYEFWSHFLCRNFNLTMYNEFRKYAFEDSRRQDATGMSDLVSYYDEVLNSRRKVIPETIARHYVELVKNEETSSERPAFQKLRASWRNGALDLKSRKKIDGLVDAKLRDELEHGLNLKTSS